MKKGKRATERKPLDQSGFFLGVICGIWDTIRQFFFCFHNPHLDRAPAPLVIAAAISLSDLPIETSSHEENRGVFEAITPGELLYEGLK